MKRQIRQLRVFTTNTLLESLRNKTFYAVLVAAALAMATAVTFGAISLRQDERIFNNFVFFSGMLFLVALAIYQGVTSIRREIDSKTVFTVLSKPVTRGSFLIGKFLASVVLMTICALLMFGFKSVIGLAYGHEITAIHLGVYFAGFLQLVMILAVGFLFSTFAVSGPLLSALFTFAVFIVGSLTPQLNDASRELAADGNPLHLFLDMTLYIVPDFEKFNLSYELSHGIEIPPSYYIDALGYTTTIVVFSLLLSVLIFVRRDLA